MTFHHTPRIHFQPLPRDKTLSILHACAGFYGIDYADMMGKNRKRIYSWPRHAAMDAVYRHTDLSSTQVADLFNTDHSTVLYAITAHRSRVHRGQMEAFTWNN